MLGYIIRRLLLMIPTLFGITFLVFMLLALAPGGIGASLRAAGGEVDADSKASLQLLYIEDRYGLDDNAVTQYLRWLGKISPIKLGTRSLRNYANDLEVPPRAVKDLPTDMSWFGDGMSLSSEDLAEIAKQNEIVADDVTEARIASVEAAMALAREREAKGLAVGSDPSAIPEFKDADKAYSRARAEYLFATRALSGAIARYAVEDTERLIAERRDQLVQQGVSPDIAEREAAGSVESVFSRAIGAGNVIDYGMLKELTPDITVPAWDSVRESATDTVRKQAEAVAALSRVQAAFDRGPYPQAGVGFGNTISFDWPDFGKSFSIGRPVLDLIGEALPVTLLLNLVAIPIIYLVAVPFGIHAASRHNLWFDKVSGTIFVMFWSIPVVWAGVLAIGFLADKDYLGWFPASGLHSNGADDMPYLPTWVAGEGFQIGYLLDLLWHIVLPVMCLVYGGFAVLAKQTRAAMLDNYTMDFVRTARAKGVSNYDVQWYHVFRNSLLPIITIFVLVFPAMLAGSVVVERIFSVPGMGSLILQAIFNMDRDVILANVFIIAVLNLIALLLADILYAMADPRVTYD
jgi:ABC-type dipeptide/oligopeptide/nickel transport system permease component